MDELRSTLRFCRLAVDRGACVTAISLPRSRRALTLKRRSVCGAERNAGQLLAESAGSKSRGSTLEKFGISRNPRAGSNFGALRWSIWPMTMFSFRGSQRFHEEGVARGGQNFLRSSTKVAGFQLHTEQRWPHRSSDRFATLTFFIYFEKLRLGLQVMIWLAIDKR